MHAGSFWRVPYVKTSVRTTRSGTVRYLQLAHNEWDAEAQRSRTRVLHNFGREDEIDKDAVRRLVAALSRLLDPAEALAAAEPGELSVTASRPAGGIHVLDQLWRRLGLDGAVRRTLVGRRLSPETERVLFALVANRALAASSKLAATEWVCSDVHVDSLDEVTDDACYRAMDHLLAIERSLAEQAYFQVTDLLNLEVDLLFFDTTSTYFETEEADEDVPRDAEGVRVAPDDERKAGEAGFRTHGKSKDSRDDLPQVIVGMAVTRDGIPVRVWSWPGNTADSGLIRQVKADLREWALSKVIWVADRGFTSEANRRALMRGGGGYIVGEKLRSGTPEVRAALSRQGRYKTVRDNLQVKEVRLGDDTDRFIICYNPDQAERDAAIRARMIAQLEGITAGTDALTPAERGRLEGSLATRPGLKRFLRHPRRPAPPRQGEDQRRGEPRRQVPPALLRPADDHRGHRARVQAAPGSRARLERHEAGHRPAPRLPPARRPHPRPRHPLLARPPAHPRRREHRRAPWNRIRAEIQRQHAVTWTGPAGTFRQATDPTKPLRDLYTALSIEPPKKILALDPAPTPS